MTDRMMEWGIIFFSLALALLSYHALKKAEILEEDVIRLERELNVCEVLKEFLIEDTAHLISHTGRPVVCVDDPLSAWDVLDLLESRLVSQGLPVKFYQGGEAR